MTLGARLERLEPALTARERFLIALRDYREGRTTEPEVRQMDAADRPEFDRCARLVIGLNERLGGYCWMLDQHAAWLGEELRTVLILDEAAGQLEAKESIPYEKPTRAWRKKEEVTVPAFLRGMALDLKESVLERLDNVWGDLVAVEMIWGEAAEEIGDDPVHPQNRERASGAKEAVQGLRAKAGARRRPPEPTEQRVEEMRRQVREAAGLGGPL